MIRNVSITIPNPREDISNEEGNHKKNAFFIYQKSGIKFDHCKWILYLPLKRIMIQSIAAIHCVKKVAMAAHETHIGGIGHNP